MAMFDTSSFRIRYRARVKKPAVILAGPVIVAVLVVLGAWSYFVAPLALGSWIGADFLGILWPIAAIAAVALGVEVLFGVDEGYPWRRSVAATGAGILGGTLLVGAWGKALDPLSFQGTIRQEGLAGWVPAWLVALVALGLEVGLGSALVLGVRRRWVLGSTGLLVAFFLFLNGRAYWRFAQGVETDGEACGCFGNLLERTPEEAFWQDFALLVPALILASLSVVSRHPVGKRVALALVLAAGAVVFAWFSPQLPVDDFATRLHPDVEVSSLCTGSGEERLCLPTLIPELSEGRHFVVMADLQDEDFGSAVEELNRYWLDGSGPRLWVLAAATPEASQTFFWQYGPSFEIHETPPGLLRPLYRSLPRSFLVTNGTVEETYDGLPPLPEPRGGASEAGRG